MIKLTNKDSGGSGRQYSYIQYILYYNERRFPVIKLTNSTTVIDVKYTHTHLHFLYMHTTQLYMYSTILQQ